jgi:hypothetical protein
MRMAICAGPDLPRPALAGSGVAAEGALDDDEAEPEAAVLRGDGRAGAGVPGSRAPREGTGAGASWRVAR